MTCPEHVHCARTGMEPERCPFCHAPWSKIVAPASYTVTRAGKSRTGEQIVVDEVRWLNGYGHLPLEHLAGHVAERRRNLVKVSRRRRVDADSRPLAARVTAERASDAESGTDRPTATLTAPQAADELVALAASMGFYDNEETA